ncbi:hypothetical protein [Bdellovibrio sp. ZAP7]|uniref:hypothetical protein n=1 Tax=Bdellovibrio sp. ZAP7 TaxID=2231053 RepID=UPI0011585793|nr:hypothetical protein [Bdellovibrio sp. ZAP7]
MNHTISSFLIIFLFATTARAESNSLVSNWGVEAGALYLNQSSGGETTTILPMLDGGLWLSGNWALNVQIGGTAYKDSSTDKTFTIGVARINPVYRIPATKFSVEALLGMQKWEEQDAKADLGLRGNYVVGNDWLSELFFGAGSVQHDEVTNYVTVGMKKWF